MLTQPINFNLTQPRGYCFTLLGKAAGFMVALLSATLLSIGVAHAQAAPPAPIQAIFPDPVLAEKIRWNLNKGNIDTIVTQDELDTIRSLDLCYQNASNISSLSGIIYLRYLKSMCISYISQAQQLEPLPDTIQELIILDTFLTQLPAKLPASLRYLSVYDNDQLTQLPDTLPANLYGLYASNNPLTRLPDTLPAFLEYLGVSSNQLTQLPDTLPASLAYLDAENNQLTRLPDTLPASLADLDAKNNQLTRLPDTLPAGLRDLDVSGNRLTQLPDTLPVSLKNLRAGNNQLSQLPNTLPTIEALYINNNRLTHLPDTLPTSLYALNVENNQLARLPDTLPTSLWYLNVCHNQLTQLPDTLPVSLFLLYVSDNQLAQLPTTLPASLGRLIVSNNQLTRLPDTLPASLADLYVVGNQLTRLPNFLSDRTFNASYNQLVQYPWPIPNEGYPRDKYNHGQWVTLPTLQRSLGNAFHFDDFAPPILQHFRSHTFQGGNAGTLAGKGQWTLIAPDESSQVLTAGDGSEINSSLFTMPGLYRLSFEVLVDDGYFNLRGSTYTQAIIIDSLDPQAHSTMQVNSTVSVLNHYDQKKTVIYADFSPQAIHLGQEGALFVFAYLPDSVALFPDTGWVKGRPSAEDSWKKSLLSTEWDLLMNCSLVHPVYKGKIGFLQKIAALHYLHDDPEAAMIPGAEFYMGYGLGTTTEQACWDLVMNQRWQKIYTMP